MVLFENKKAFKNLIWMNKYEYTQKYLDMQKILLLSSSRAYGKNNYAV